MRQMKVASDENKFALFIRSCVEAIVETYRKLKNTPGGGLLAYQVVDAFARLVVKTITKDNNCDNAVMRFSRTLSIIVLEVVHMHSIRREMFDQKPFFRLLSSILHELKSAEEQLGAINERLIVAFG